MTGMERMSCDNSATQDPPLHQATCTSNINSTTHWNINPILHFFRISNQCRVNQVNVPKEDDQSVQGIFRRVRKIAKKTISFVMAVRPSVHMEQLGSHWKDLHEIYLRIFRKSVDKIQVSLKSDRNKGYFT